MGIVLAPSLVRARFIELSETAFPIIEPVLAREAGKQISLRGIGETELSLVDEWRQHPACIAVWSWRKVLHDFRRKPKRMDVSFYAAGQLCGLMIATISKARVNVNVAYVEASPDPDHPLKKEFLGVAMLQAELFGAVIEATHVSVSKPHPKVVPMYHSLGYEMLSADRARVSRGGKPRYELLIKAIQ